MRTRTYLILLAILPALARPVQAQQQDSLVRIRVSELFARGYSLIPSKQGEAMTVFEEIVLLDSSNVLAWRQLGSLYINAGDIENAIRCFVVANRLMPSDTTRLQLAYLHTTLKQNQRAYELFDSLAQSPDSSIRAKAIPAAVVLSLMRCQALYPWWYRLQAYPFFDTRFDNLIFTASCSVGYLLTESRVIGLMGTLALSRDTRSEGGAYPVIYSDNVLLMNAGLRMQPLPGMTVDILGGMGIDLVDRNNTHTVREDFRALVSYGNGIYPEIAVTDRLEWVGSVLADGYSSFGYYSRYHNGLGYLQARAGARLAALGRTALDAFARGNFSVDTRKDFYNNTLEGGLGIAIIPDYTWGLSLETDILWGTYWSAGQSTNTYGKNYSSVRIYLLFDRFLCL